jgi:hypothetical protein
MWSRPNGRCAPAFGGFWRIPDYFGFAGGASTGPPAAPRAEAAGDVRDRAQAHALRGLRRQRRAPAAAAEEHELLVFGEFRFVVRAFRIDPEFQHAARAMKGARDAAFAFQLADVAQIDPGHVVTAVLRDRGFHRQGLDLAFGGFDQRAKSVLMVCGIDRLACCRLCPGGAGSLRSMAARRGPKPNRRSSEPRPSPFPHGERAQSGALR